MGLECSMVLIHRNELAHKINFFTNHATLVPLHVFYSLKKFGYKSHLFVDCDVLYCADCKNNSR